jgi:RNA polymerase sigma-70 factor (sigma-E family)
MGTGNRIKLSGVLMVVYGDQATGQAEPLDAAFERFVVRVSPLLMRAGFLLTGDRGHAEDLTQTALLRVYRRWGSIGQSRDAYASEVLVNLARDRGRALRRRPPEVQWGDRSNMRAADECAQLLERDTLARAVRQLPRRQREVVALRFFLDLSVAQIANALGTSEGAVKAYAARALKRLRTLVEPDESAHEAGSEVPDAH